MTVSTSSLPEILLVEDHPAVREGMELLLSNAGFPVVGAVGSIAEGLRLHRLRRPALVVTDYRVEDGLAPDFIRALGPETPVVVYTGTTDPGAHTEILASGALGLVLKGSTFDRLVAAIRVVAGGDTYIDPALSPRKYQLTRRQREVLRMIADGLTGTEVAEQMVVSPETVRTHIRNAMSRLGAGTRAHAVALAVSTHEIRLAHPS